MTKRSVALSAPAKNGAIRIGQLYQASIPKCLKEESDKPEEAMDDISDTPEQTRATCVYSSELAREKSLSDDDLLKVIEAGARNNIDQMQALVFLHFKGYDLKRTLALLPMYGQFPSLWDDEDQKMFEDGLGQFGKDFSRVQEFLPHKTRSDLVDRYYKIKKKTTLKLRYRSGKRKKTDPRFDIASKLNRDSSDDGDSNSVSDELSSVEKEDEDQQSHHSEYPSLSDCYSTPNSLKSTENSPPFRIPMYPRRPLIEYESRPEPSRVWKTEPKKKKKPKRLPVKTKKYSKTLPPGFHFDKEEFEVFMKQNETIRASELKRVTREYEKANNESLQRQKKIENLRMAAVDAVQDLRPNEELTTPTPNWNPREIMMVIVIFTQYGADCEKAAEILCTKTVEQVEEYRDLMKERLSNFDSIFYKKE